MLSDFFQDLHDINKFINGFLKGDDLVDGHGGALWEGGVLLEQAPEGCEGWNAGDARVHIGNFK
jgi:hypothetical protein